MSRCDETINKDFPLKLPFDDIKFYDIVTLLIVSIAHKAGMLLAAIFSVCLSASIKEIYKPGLLNHQENTREKVKVKGKFITLRGIYSSGSLSYDLQ